MGVSQHNLGTETQSEFLERLMFVEEVMGIEDDSSRKIQIYKFKQPPYEYLMKHQKIFMFKDPSFMQYLTLMKQLNHQINHHNLVKIHHVTVKEDVNMCIRYITLNVFINYYTFQLQTILNNKKIDDIRFTENEIWYIANCLLNIGQYLQKIGIAYGSYGLDKINVSPQGYIKLYTHHLSQNNRHCTYYKLIEDRMNISKYLPVPPQYLNIMASNYDYNFKPNLFVGDAFMIGLTLLQLMHGQPTDKYYYYRQRKIGYNTKKVLEDIKILEKIYSPILCSLIRNLLEENPDLRYTFTQGSKYIASVRNNISISGSIRMFQDDQNPIHPKISFRDTILQQYLNKNLLLSVNIHLAVTPIGIYKNRDKLSESTNLSIKNTTTSVTRIGRLSSLQCKRKLDNKIKTKTKPR